ncbi:ESAT-6 protein secretion system EspG family protein [Saccharothrix saharensis]|uniref:ESAT-6 protein secretion system EspG family protein n=1 Tax=Saccharothrix saharensis TaxID=571190 RepID=A0A543J645_9PSEU|nr:ESX secretion-associated protein EspG [Saccharothrix saharensis]TQM78293.1 ESAT-6 protein secretion system EspG family protein [Saccharothrix saharensis]
MTAAIEHEAVLDPVELDLLATHAGVAFPFPIRVPSFGRVTRERDDLLAGAGHALRARGLATATGPVGVTAELVTALREHRGAVDLVVIGTTGATGAVAVVHQDRAVVCRQPLHGDRGGQVTVTAVPATRLAGELAALIPAVRAAATLPITLPPGVVEGALRILGDPECAPATPDHLRELVRACGGDGTAVDRLVDLFPAVSGRGQLGVVRRADGPATRPHEVSWLDSARGRVRVDRGDGGWTSVNPLRHDHLVRLLRESAALARA